LEALLARLTNWAGHAVKQTGWNLNPRTALSGLALVGGLALLAAFYLALSSQTAVLGRRLQELDKEYTHMVQENASLRDQIARARAVFTMTQRALTARYVTTGTVLFLPVGVDQALDQGQSPAPP
jgi:hypothetical protein